MMSQQAALILAMSSRDYFPKRVRGHWYVWSKASDHYVEFCEDVILAAERAAARKESAK